jgi:integrase
MAAVVRRKRSDGSTAYRVIWREGGRSGRQQSETFDTPKAAERFKADVEAAKNRWPVGWTPGVGYLAPGAQAEAEPVKFADFAELYLNTRTRVGPYQLKRYRMDIGQMAESFPTVEAVDDQAVAAWVRSLLAQGRRPKTIANKHGLLFAICAYAVKKGVLRSNPCVDTQLPEREPVDEDGDPISSFLEPAAPVLGDQSPTSSRR